MKRVIILIFLLPMLTVAQVTDTTKFKKLLTIEDLADSIRKEIIRLEKEIQRMKENVVEGSEFSKLLSLLEEEENENIIEDQRSSNRRLDALLQAMTNRPGQVRLNGSAISVIHNKFSNKSASSAVGLVDLFATTSFGGESLFFIYFQAKGGDGLDQQVNSFISPDANSGSTQSSDGLDAVLIPEVWAEFSLFENDMKFTIGKLDLTNYFDNNNYANDEYSQFIMSSFVNSAAIPFTETTPAVRVRTNILHRFFIQFAIANSHNSGNKIFDSLIKAGSFGFKVFPDEEYEGNIRIYGYLLKEAKNKIGFGISFDQKFFNFFGIFFRWGSNPNEYKIISNIKRAWSTGIVYRSIINNKKFASGIAFGNNKSFSSYLNNELNLELYVRYQINKWVGISQHFQAIWNIAGSDKHTYLAAIKAQINF